MKRSPESAPRRLLRLVTVLAVIVGTLLLPAATTAQAALSSVRVLPEAGIQARGVAAVVQVVHTCSPGSSGSLWVTVSQKQPDGSVIQGGGGATVSGGLCVASPQRIRLAVVAVDPSTGQVQSGFRQGEAFVTATTSFCDPSSCENRTDARTVTVGPAVLDRTTFSPEGASAQIPSVVRIEAGGAGAVARVPYTCTPGRQVTLGAVLLERLPDGTRVLVGSTSTRVDCTGSTRTAVLGFHPSGGAAWVPGSALLVVDLLSCGPEQCDQRPPGFRGVQLRTASV